MLADVVSDVNNRLSLCDIRFMPEGNEEYKACVGSVDLIISTRYCNDELTHYHLWVKYPLRSAEFFYLADNVPSVIGRKIIEEIANVKELQNAR